VNNEEVDIWFRTNNIIIEKMELYYDIVFSLYRIISDTYLGDDENTRYETKIEMDIEDKNKHFEWCWKKLLDDFQKENLEINKEGTHREYFFDFFNDIFYNQKDSKIRNSIDIFFTDIFDMKKPFTKSDLDMILTIYKLLDKNINY
jgi:uncharacterized membrane protein